MTDRLRQKERRPTRRRYHAVRPWMPEEDRIIDRHARALAGGKYRGITDTARACAQDIGRLYASLRKADPRHYIASRERPLSSIRLRVRSRLSGLGLIWVGRNLTPKEERVLSRHVRGVVCGRYHDTRQAAEACTAELSRLAGVGRARPLSIEPVRRRIYLRARELKKPWAYTSWDPDDAQVAERYARAIARGEYSTVAEAALACYDELAKRRRAAGDVRSAGRPLGAVMARLRELVHTKGLQKYWRWNKAERRVVQRYLKALYAGRFRYIRQAADACAREMRRRLNRTNVHRGASFSTAPYRSDSAVYEVMVQIVMRLGLPRYKGETTRAEQRLFEKYARGVSQGRFRDCLEASRACAAELRRLHADAGRSSALTITRMAGRSPRGLRNHILLAARRLRLHIPRGRWTEDEIKVVCGWVRWYERYRRVWRMAPLRTAASGLQEELESIGSRRTQLSCQWRILTERRRLLGMA